MADLGEVDDLEPLFDYHRVQPHTIVSLDDDEKLPFSRPKRRKVSDPAVGVKEGVGAKEIEVVSLEDEEDWLPPPPKVFVQNQHNEDSAIKELRLKKQELVLFAKSADDVIRAVEESVKGKLGNSALASVAAEAEAENASKPACERAKVVVSVQDKDGLKQFRMYMDDKFELLFKMYADRVKIDLQNLVFSFDGDKIGPAATPAGLEMEDDDIIEVHVKKNVKGKLGNSALASVASAAAEAEAENASKPACERAKVVVSVQDKDGLKQFRMYMDDKFELLFKMYADRVKIDLQNLVFSFDGDKISPAATPAGLEMEDDDIIEVHVKKS